MARTTRRRITAGARRFGGPPAVLGAFVVGAMFAALLAQGRDPATPVAAGAAGGAVAGPTGTTFASAGSGPVGTSPVTTAAGSAAGGAATYTPPPAGTTPTSAARAAGGRPAGGPATTASSDNGGATAPGVTANTITVGVLGGSSEALAPVCPRCGQGGLQTDKDLLAGLVRMWHRQGKLPIYGRDLNPVIVGAQDLAAESARSACQQVAGAKPFAAVTAPGTEPASYQCLAGEFHIPTLDGTSTTDETVQQYPLYFTLGASLRKEYTNGAAWADANGLLKGQTIGLYTPADSSSSQGQQYINLFRQALAARGYKIAVDYQYQSTGQSDDAIAVQQMRSKGVTVMFVVGTFTEPSGFQNAAAKIGYRPKYPIIDVGFAFNDAVADVGYNATEEDGNVGMALHYFDFVQRRPAVPRGNQAAADCLQAYEDQVHKPLDSFDDTAKIAYILEICSDLTVMLQGIKNAGPNLTVGSFVAGLEAISSMQTGLYQKISFDPGKHAGLDVFTTAHFNKARWQPENLYWRNGPWTPWAAG